MKKRIMIAAVTVVCVFCLFAYILPFPVTARKAERRARSDYAAHKAILTQLVNETDFRESFLSDLSGITRIQLPDEIKSLGIGDAFVVRKMLFLEYEDAIMGITSFGIMFANDVSSLEEWYKIDPIENGWYFYRVLS